MSTETKKELSQYDLGGVLKSAHQDENQALRTTSANTSVPPSYSRVSLTYNASDSVTRAEFYQGLLAERRHITFVADVAGSLNNTYFTLYAENDEALYHIWYNVSGGGTDPVPANSCGIEIPIATNDVASIVKLATQLVLEKYEDFNAKELAPDKLRIENSRNGLASNSADVGTGFTVTTVQQGTEQLIKCIDVPFDGTTIYKFNTQEKKFEIFPETVQVELTGGTVTPIITNLSLPTANTEVDHTLQSGLKKILIRNRNNGKLQFAFTDTESGTDYITIPPGASYDSGEINFVSGTLSIQSNKASQTVEILEWA